MRRFLFAAALCVLTAVSGAWTLQWDADSSWPAGTTVTACLNSVCVNGVTGNSQSFSEVYPPGTVLRGTAQAVPPVGYQCGEPLADCPPSAVAEIAQTIPADQGSPNQSAWTTSTNGGAMAGFNFVTGSFVSYSTTSYVATPSVNTAVSAQSGDVILLVVSFDWAGSPSLSSVSSTNTTWTQVADFSHTGNDQIFKLWKGVVTGSISSGSSITANLSTSAHYVSLQAAIFRSDNGSAANPVQTSANTLYAAGANPTTTNGMTVTVAPTGTNSLTIIEILEIEDSPGATADSSPGTGFTQISEGDIFNGEVGPYLWAIKTGVSAGSQSVTATYAQPCSYNSSILAVVLEGGSSSSQTYNYSGSGGIVTGGAAALKRTQASTASGGISTGGAASLKRTFANQASGGITTGGAASASKSSGNSYTASGGITTGGAAALKRTQASTASGGISTGGVGGLKLVKTVSGAGGVATGGAAALKRAFARFSSGGLVTGGTAPLKLVKTTTASGGITTGGAAGLKRTQTATATGGIVTGGAATASKSSPGQNSHTASGGITTGGAATLKRTQTAVGAGGIATGGAATLKRSFARLASGGLSTGGAATLKQIRAYLASGGLATGGAASVTLMAGAFSHIASGGITTGGSASLRILLNFLASGGISLGGSAVVSASSMLTILPSGRVIVLQPSERFIVPQPSERFIVS